MNRTHEKQPVEYWTEFVKIKAGQYARRCGIRLRNGTEFPLDHKIDRVGTGARAWHSYLLCNGIAELDSYHPTLRSAMEKG